jgi:dephospho-CoA kinase
MLRVGLTGNIASGKSTVARIWQSRGARIVDADVLARKAVERGSPGLAAVIAAFGDDILRSDASLDRAALRRRVFADADARKRLEAIIHPEVERLREQEERTIAGEGARVIVHDIPLLFELGMEPGFDAVVLVDAPESARRQRLMRTRGLSEQEAAAMISAQSPGEPKRARATFVIDNAGTHEQLATRASYVWNEIEKLAQRSA